jgi:hypothetical protein
VYALSLAMRHPGTVRGAILHEPALFALFDDPAAVRAAIGAVVAPAMESGGPRAALEQFVRFVAGDANWERFNAGLRERMLASAETYLTAEIGRFDTWLPSDEELAAIPAPVQLLVSDDSIPSSPRPRGIWRCG